MCLEFLVCGFVGLEVSNTVGSGIASGVGILSRFFIANILHLKLLRTFFSYIKRNPKFF